MAFAPAVLASIYKDLNLLNQLIVSSTKHTEHSSNSICIKDESELILRAPLHFVQILAWERFPSLQPKPSAIYCGEPRVARWQKTVEEVNRLAYEHQVWEKEACTVRSGSSLSCVFQGYETKAVESLFYDEDDYLMVSEFLRRRRLLKEGITVPDNQELLPSTHNQSSSALNDGARTPTEREALMKSKPLKETLETLNVKSKELDGDNAYVVSQMVQLKSKDNNDKGFCKLNLPDSLELASKIPKATRSDGRFVEFLGTDTAKMSLQISNDSLDTH
ncbi:putative 2S albumin-like [Capsicum annuum]|nr:putative 2S albumin-like [Capsicum annuum]